MRELMRFFTSLGDTLQKFIAMTNSMINMR
jgi:hypothetical protein